MGQKIPNFQNEAHEKNKTTCQNRRFLVFSTSSSACASASSPVAQDPPPTLGSGGPGGIDARGLGAKD